MSSTQMHGPASPKVIRHQSKSTTFLSLVEACDESVLHSHILYNPVLALTRHHSFPDGPVGEEYYTICLPGDIQPYGYMTPEVVTKMPWTPSFAVNHSAPRSVTVLDHSRGVNTADAINRAFAELISICIEQDLFHVLSRRHSEPSAILGVPFSKPVYVERFAVALFGLVSRGAHLVAYVNGFEGTKVWVSRRSNHLYTYPGCLDVTVGGGIKSGDTPFDTIIEEADEEASLPEGLVRKQARSRGVISHMSTTGPDFRGEKGLVVSDYIYVYDIELPSDVVPRPHDDEVQGFQCLTIEELQAALLRNEFKTDSAAVLVYFMILHGIITPENEKDFAEINMRLHRRLPFKISQ
jgi:hypothetical protein